jgi:hypothetical protein
MRGHAHAVEKKLRHEGARNVAGQNGPHPPTKGPNPKLNVRLYAPDNLTKENADGLLVRVNGQPDPKVVLQIWRLKATHEGHDIDTMTGHEVKTDKEVKAEVNFVSEEKTIWIVEYKQTRFNVIMFAEPPPIP